jgi:hypothetical protein
MHLTGTSMQAFSTDISKCRSEMEAQMVDYGNTGDTTVQLITLVQQMKKQDQVDLFIAGQKLLTLQGYSFPTSWLYAEHVHGEWSALMDVLSLIEKRRIKTLYKLV